MRLFIAVNFREEIKDRITAISKKVEQYAEQGRFTQKAHMHLTLEFLGEVPEERVKEVEAAMEAVKHSPFTIALSGLGYFKRQEGNIYWLGIAGNDELMTLQKELHRLLLAKGFKLESREYRPHITLGRKVRLKNTFAPEELKGAIRAIEIPVNSIDLMESKTVAGKLIYTKIYTKTL